MSEKTDTEVTDNRSSLGRLLKTFDKVQEDIALINYLLAKRDVREQLSNDQITGLVQQSNSATSSLNAVAVLLDGIVPLRTRTLSMSVEGSLPKEPGQGSLLRAAMDGER